MTFDAKTFLRNFINQIQVIALFQQDQESPTVQMAFFALK